MIKFAHTNIITDDWRKLADFYINVFGCKPLYPERNLSGEWLDKASSVRHAHIRGIHLALPGYDSDLPTLEIFQYDRNLPDGFPAANRKGFGHIAFRVDDVEEILALLVTHGGTQLGEMVEAPIQGAGTIIFVYAKDIDGNIIELQHWKN